MFKVIFWTNKRALSKPIGHHVKWGELLFHLCISQFHLRPAPIPLPGWLPGISIFFFALDGKFPGVEKKKKKKKSPYLNSLSWVLIPVYFFKFISDHHAIFAPELMKDSKRRPKRPQNTVYIAELKYYFETNLHDYFVF